MTISNMDNFQFESIVDPSLTNIDEPAAQGSLFDEIYPFGAPGGDFADAPQADAPFDFDTFDFDQPAVQDVDSGFALPTGPQSPFPDQRYVSFPSPTQTHFSPVWHPLEQPVQQDQYPDPEMFSQTPLDPTPYYPLQPLQHNFGAITPPGHQFSSIDRPLFLHGNSGPPQATAGVYHYEPIPTYQDNGTFNPEDLALSDILPEELVTAAISGGWDLPGLNNTQQGLLAETNTHKRPLPDDPFLPNALGHDNDSDVSDSDADYRPSPSSAGAKRARRTRASKQPQALLPNGEVKKGRPCAKPQTEERRRINQRRMEGYYRRKYDQGNLEKARQQSKESYWRRKQRRIEAGEKVRSYGALKRGRVGM